MAKFLDRSGLLGDIIGKKENKPIYELLGGRARPIDVSLSTGEMHEPEKRVDELLAMAEQGYKTAKIRAKKHIRMG